MTDCVIIIAGKLSDGASVLNRKCRFGRTFSACTFDYASVGKNKEKHHVQKKRIYPVRNQSNSESARISCGISNGIYVNRAFGGDFHNCVIDGDIAAHAPGG